MKNKGLTISDWIIGLEERGHALASELHSVKEIDYLRLKLSGLPIYKDFSLSYLRFIEKPRDLISFLNRYEMFVVRALPSTSNLPRRYKKGVKDYRQASEFLNSVINPRKKDLYTILITEQEPQKFAGLIALRPDSAIIEVGMSGLDNFSHGLGKRWVGCFDNEGINKFRAREYKTSYKIPINEKIKEIMNKALIYIKRSKRIHNQGYFEFIVTKDDEIKFVDYKINKAYT